jgi:hypothetical protein
MVRLFALLLLALGIGPAWGQPIQPPGLPNTGGTVNGNLAVTGALTQLSRSAQAAATDNFRINGYLTIPAWTPSTQYGNGAIVSNGGKYYQEEWGTNCTSGTGAGPSGTTFMQVGDGTCEWINVPASVLATGADPAPTILPGTTWVASHAYAAGQTVVTISGTGTARIAHFYTEDAGTSTCTSASSGGPTGTGTLIVDNTCNWDYAGYSLPSAPNGSPAINSFLWTTPNNLPTVMNFYGGTVTTGSNTYEYTASTTVGSQFGSGSPRYEFVTDAQTFIIRTLESATFQSSAWRLIVCGLNRQHCHYVSPNPYTMSATGGGTSYTVVDFSAVGGRQPRDIILENDGNGAMIGIDLGLLDDIYKPGGMRPLAIAVTGDSYGSGGGMEWLFGSFIYLLADELGIQNVINTSIGGCGYSTLGSCPSGTALARISDEVGNGTEGGNNGACPDIALDENGSNDTANFTATQLAAAQRTYLTALHVACPRMPVFIMGIWTHSSGVDTTDTTDELAMAADIAAAADPREFWCPVTTDPAGQWQTGTGRTGAWSGTASFSGTTMTVTATVYGQLQWNMYLSGSGIGTNTNYINSLDAGGHTGTGGNGTYGIFTGVGTVGSEAVTGTAQNGSGNTDYSIEYQGTTASDHPNELGNRMHAARLLACVRRALNVGAY